VENITVARSGDFVDITFFINHGSDFTSPAAYAGTVAGPDLPAGTYTFRQFVRQRFFGQGGYSNPPVLQYSKTVVVTNASNVGEAVEYYNSNLHHYFMTASSNEIAALDAGVFSGWSRTGQVFPGLYLGNPSTDAAVTPVAPVCRYYGVPSAGLDTHFFTAFATECAVIPQLWPNSWILETPNAFYVSLPSITDGSCPDGTVPLYRLFNGRPDVNHRYTTSLEIRQQMIRKLPLLVDSRNWTFLAGFCAGGKSDEEVAVHRIANRGDFERRGSRGVGGAVGAQAWDQRRYLLPLEVEVRRCWGAGAQAIA
jgi:hypothetical protein